MTPGVATSSCASRLFSAPTFVGEGLFGKRAMKSPFTRHFFLINNHTPRDRIPRTRLAVAQARGPIGPHVVVMKSRAWSGIRSRKPARKKNITALMMNEPGSIRLPPGINSQVLAFQLPGPDSLVCRLPQRSTDKHSSPDLFSNSPLATRHMSLVPIFLLSNFSFLLCNRAQP